MAAKTRKNPLIGSVIANPALFAKKLQPGQKMYFNIGRSSKAYRSDKRPQYIVIEGPPAAAARPAVRQPVRQAGRQVVRPAARRRVARPASAAGPAGMGATAAVPAAPPPAAAPYTAASHTSGPAPKKAAARHRRRKAGKMPVFPPFTPPSQQVRENPSLFGGGRSAAGDIATLIAQAIGAFVVLGLGIPLVKRVMLNVLKKPETGAGGSPSIASHAAQLGLSAAAFAAAEKTIRDGRLKTLVQGTAVITAAAPLINHLIEKMRPGSALRLLGDAGPVRLSFDVEPQALDAALASDLEDLDSSPAIDRLLTEKAALPVPEFAQTAEASPVPALAPGARPEAASGGEALGMQSGPGEPLFPSLGNLIDPDDFTLHFGALHIN
ncbi:MAG: hypothetical protein KIT79_16020 [Deltaproteobacteria bacterium]|nr:hypothetical protein [Deltaproteobacteria bacterium]